MSTTSLKIIVIGDRGVGKTSLIQHYVYDSYNEKVIRPYNDDDDGLNADFMEKRVNVNGREMVVSFWDQPSPTPPPSFYTGVHGCCFVFSTVNVDSLHRLQFWYDLVEKHFSDQNGNRSPPMVIAENKRDEMDSSVVNASEVEKAAKQYKVKLYRTSAKTGDQVNQLFEYITAEAAAFQLEQNEIDGVGVDGPETRTNRVSSIASWILPNDDATSIQNAEPSKRRTGGAKPIFNKNKCPIM